MKNKLLMIIIALLECLCIILMIYLFVSSNNEIKEIERTLTSEYSMVIVDGTLTRTGCDIEIYYGDPPIGLSRHSFSYYSIDVLEKNKWKELEPIPGAEKPDPNTVPHYESKLISETKVATNDLDIGDIFKRTS